MILVTEKKLMGGKKHKEKFAFGTVSQALRYTAARLDTLSEHQQIYVGTWQHKTKTKFGFVVNCENGDQVEISLEDVQEMDPG